MILNSEENQNDILLEYDDTEFIDETIKQDNSINLDKLPVIQRNIDINIS